MGIYSKLLDYIRAKKTVIIDSMRISLYTNAISEINKDIDYIEAIEDELIQNAAYKSQVYLSRSEIENANNNPVQYSQLNGVLRYVRDKRMHSIVIKNSDYKCNYKVEHETFSATDGNRFMEGHHLVPLKFQTQFGYYRLDRFENIESMCPICHSAIHYGNDEIKRTILENLYNKSKMKELLIKFKVNSFIEFYDRFYL